MGLRAEACNRGDPAITCLHPRPTHAKSWPGVRTGGVAARGWQSIAGVRVVARSEGTSKRFADQRYFVVTQCETSGDAGARGLKCGQLVAKEVRAVQSEGAGWVGSSQDRRGGFLAMPADLGLDVCSLLLAAVCFSGLRRAHTQPSKTSRHLHQ